jgi:pimeloyl-ACP methyl ester carboxylesterase
MSKPMGLGLCVMIALASALAAQEAAGPETVWEGALKLTAGVELRIVLHVVDAGEGGLRATFDSPDQGAKGIKLDTVSVKPESLSFTLKSAAIEFTGKRSGDGNEAVGQWTQGGVSVPLTLRKVDRPSERRRPQTPRPPFPYREEPVTYENKAAGVTLAGTLTIPRGEGPFPAVILISGSGPQDRDETIFEHKPFLVLADALTRRGIGVLRVDDRGVGGSSGGRSTATSEDYAGDVRAGIAYLKSRPEIDGNALGLIGHSEGGIIAPLVAVESADVAFIVLMAGTGVPGDEILVSQLGLILKAMGVAQDKLEKTLDQQRRLVAIAKSETDKQKAMEAMQAIVRESREQLPEKERAEFDQAKQSTDAQLRQIGSPWFKFFLNHDPRATLARVRCPVLALCGEKDLQVDPRANLAAIEAALKSGGNERVTIKELPGLNHLFQTSATGLPSDYARIEETIAPSVLTLIGDWITGQLAVRK